LLNEKEKTMEIKNEMYHSAVMLVAVTQQVSTSLFQKKLKIGYSLAGNILERMEKEELIGEFRGAKARDVFIKLDDNDRVIKKIGPGDYVRWPEMCTPNSDDSLIVERIEKTSPEVRKTLSELFSGKNSSGIQLIPVGTECECGHYAPDDLITYDENGCGTCPSCQIEFQKDLIVKLKELVKEIADPELSNTHISLMIRDKYAQALGCAAEDLDWFDNED